MEKIIVSKKIVDDSLRSGFKYIESNQFDKGIKYLTYAAENGAIRDQFLIYALIISNYNMGNFDLVQEYIKEIKNINIDNNVILETIKQIESEILNLEENDILDIKDKAKKVIEDIKNLKFIQEKMPLNVKELEELVENTDDKTYSFILKPVIEGELYENFKSTENDFVNVLMYFENFKNEYYKDNKSELNLYKYYNHSLKRKGHSLFILSGIKSGVFYTILRDKSMSHLKNEIIYDMLAFNLTGYVLDDMLEEVLLAKYKKIDILKVKDEILSIENSLKNTILYKDVNLFNYTMNLVIKFYKTNISIIDKLDKDEIITRILSYYYYSNIALNEDLKDFIKSNYKLDKRKYKKTMNEINKLNLII